MQTRIRQMAERDGEDHDFPTGRNAQQFQDYLTTEPGDPVPEYRPVQSIAEQNLSLPDGRDYFTGGFGAKINS
jgi:hypothetical protein